MRSGFFEEMQEKRYVLFPLGAGPGRALSSGSTAGGARRRLAAPPARAAALVRGLVLRAAAARIRGARGRGGIGRRPRPRRRLALAGRGERGAFRTQNHSVYRTD